MDRITVRPRSQLNAVVSIPGSKSCTARALVIAALTQGTSTLIEPADCDDTDYMVSGLQGLGVEATREPARITVKGARFRTPGKPLFLGNSGTAMRFLTAACATLDGEVVLDGSPRMRERPIGDLLAALQGWGVVASSDTGCPPVHVQSTGNFGGGTRIAGNASSQFLSGLLMAAPLANRTCTILVQGELVSTPYVDLTLAMIRERGAAAEHEHYQRFEIRSGQSYTPGVYPIEADASGASYFLAAAAIAGGRVSVLNLSTRSHQGDAQFVRLLEQMGCQWQEGPDWIEVTSSGRLKGITVDLNRMPDMAQTLGVTALFAEGATEIRNVANLRIKECDRIRAMVTELRKLGAEVEEFDDGFRVTPRLLHGAQIETYDDHRMAMSFAPAGLKVPGIVIKNPLCVRKTFPDFFERFDKLS